MFVFVGFNNMASIFLDASTNPQFTTSDKTDHPPSAASHPVHKPPLPPQSSGSMVSYEDMVKNSPRNKTKHKDKARRNSMVRHLRFAFYSVLIVLKHTIIIVVAIPEHYLGLRYSILVPSTDSAHNSCVLCVSARAL